MNIIKVKSETVVKIIKNEIELGSELRVVGIGDEPMFFKENESDKLIKLIQQTDTIRNRYIDLNDRILIIGYEFHAPIQVEVI